MLDANEMAKGQKFFSIGGTHVSDDGNLLAFATDTTGFREYYLSVKDLRSGKIIDDRIVKNAGAAWSADNKTLFYVTEDHAKRPHKLWRHLVGEPREKDVLVHEEKDELFRLGVSRSHDRKYLYHSSRSSTTTEQWYLPADQPEGKWTVILKREDRHEYSADHREGLFYIRTNHDGCTNFKIVTCPIEKPEPANWKDFV